MVEKVQGRKPSVNDAENAKQRDNIKPKSRGVEKKSSAKKAISPTAHQADVFNTKAAGNIIKSGAVLAPAATEPPNFFKYAGPTFDDKAPLRALHKPPKSPGSQRLKKGAHLQLEATYEKYAFYRKFQALVVDMFEHGSFDPRGAQQDQKVHATRLARIKADMQEIEADLAQAKTTLAQVPSWQALSLTDRLP